MHICLVAEGCYPYIVGGVSSWIQSLITNLPEYEFSLIVMNPEKKMRGQFKYDLPENVIDIQEYFFDEMLEGRGTWNKKIKVKYSEINCIRKLFKGEKIDWNPLFEMFHRLKNQGVSAVDFVLSKTFYELIQESYDDKYETIPFTEIFWTLRSMYIPLFSLFENVYPSADVFHCVSTGYAGVVGAYASKINNKPLILTEHGIYTREREEEIIKSDWVEGHFKDMWINFFKAMSDATYNRSDEVVSLFNRNKEFQVELGCSEEKIRVIHNGVKLQNFENVVKRIKGDDEPVLVVGIVRVVPIKDIMTMLHTFSIIEKKRKNVEFLILGPTDENEEYYESCLQYMKYLGTERVKFTGRVDIRDYLGEMDIHVLTSISEGQPLTVLETMACNIPNVTTNVGDCHSMIYGVDDDYGVAGSVVNVMDYEGLADAIIKLVDDKDLREEYGVNGYNRVIDKYDFNKFTSGYRDLYHEFDRRG